MEHGIKQIEILFSTKIIDKILKDGNRIDKETEEFLKYLKKEKKRHEKIIPIPNYVIRANDILR